MLYIDLLDSVKTAHPEKYSHEWWRADSVSEQEDAIKIAHTAMMVRLLYGETLVMPNNQANDSVGWLRAADAFNALGKHLDWAPVAIAAFGSSQSKPTSEYLLEVTLKNFSDPNFVFSAWVGLGQKQKEKIVSNLKKDTPSRFAEMMDGVKSEFGSELDDKLIEQALGLQRLYSYLVDWEKKGLVVINSNPTNYSIGKHMSKLKGEEESTKVLKRIAKNITKLHGKAALEARSLWYRYLEQIEEPVRSNAKAYVDRYYNEKLSISVNKGKALFTFTDHNPDSPLVEDELNDNLADQSRKDGVLSKVALQVYPQKIHGVSSLDWKTCTEIVADTDFKNSLNALLYLYREFDGLEKNKEYFRKYRDWRKQMWEKLQKHNDFLAKSLAPAVSLDSTGMRLIVHAAPHTIPAAFAVASSTVGYIQGIPLAESALAGGVIGYLSSVLFDSVKEKILPNLIKTSAAGRIRASLDEAISIKPDEELLK
jgi:hypothetical protein